METRWALVDGVTLELPADCTVYELRDALYKPDDAVLVAVTGDLVSIVHDEPTTFGVSRRLCGNVLLPAAGGARPK